jgi:hypothetical protein
MLKGMEISKAGKMAIFFYPILMIYVSYEAVCL